MTLLSQPFLTVNSTSNTIASNDHTKPSSRSTCSSPSDPTPNQVLAMTIKKKRRILRCKDRDLRVELLLTSTIRRLCQEIGDHLRSKRLANVKRKSSTISTTPDQDSDPSTVTVRQCENKRTRLLAEDSSTRKQEVGPVESSNNFLNSCSLGTLVAETSNSSEAPTNDDTSRGQLRKRKSGSEEDSSERYEASSPKFSKSNHEDSFNEKDPFGLDDFFRSLRTCKVGGSNR